MARGSHPKKADASYCAPSRVPQLIIEEEKGTTYRVNEEDSKKLRRIEEQQKNQKTEKKWMPVQGSFPRLVFETQNKMNDFNASDMLYKNEDRDKIEEYGWLHPFKQEKIFKMSAEEHFTKMRHLEELFSRSGKTKDVYSTMVDKFERNEGGYYMHPLLDDALKSHNTTANFHSVLKKCLAENIKEGILDKNIVNISSNYMRGSHGVSLPHFQILSGLFLSDDLFNGTVLTVHGIWSMQVFADELEYKGNIIRGKYRYNIQDHFGLDKKDINHPDLNKLPFELLAGFCSWYVLQHYKGFGYKPFITQIRFKL